MVQFESEIKKAANNFGLNPMLLQALCTKESNLNNWAVRFEPAWKLFVEPQKFATKNNISLVTEKNLQCTSFGLGQVIGCVARELGFSDNLVKLCIPEIGLQYSAMKLSQLLKKYESLPVALAAYNAGNPTYQVGKQYANDVLKIFDNIEKEMAKKNNHKI